MEKSKKILSERAKNEIATEMGIKEKVKKEGWGDISSKDCGNIVKKAVENVINENNK